MSDSNKAEVVHVHSAQFAVQCCTPSRNIPTATAISQHIWQILSRTSRSALLLRVPETLQSNSWKRWDLDGTCFEPQLTRTRTRNPPITDHPPGQD